MITCCNLMSGCTATLYAFFGDAETALMWIVIGAVFDFFDGLTARALGVSSPIGKELDSLADVITFGFAPSAIIFHQLLIIGYPEPFQGLCEYMPFVAFIMAAFSALRLAKFNIDTRQTTSFIGLPTPANALFWGSLLVGYNKYIEEMEYGFAIILILVLISSYMLVCELPMFALKFKHWGIKDDDNIVKYGFLVFSGVLIISTILSGNAISSIAIIILAYILVSVFMQITKKDKK